jgi:hypothetical protein
MNGETLIRQAEKCGARLWAEGSRLELDIPDTFPHSLLEQLREYKAEVLSWLVLPEDAWPLIDWACWLVESIPSEEVIVKFQETPLRPVSLRLVDVGGYVSRCLGYLGALQSAETAVAPDLRSGWRRERIEELCNRLIALREALRPLGLAEIGRDYP